MKTKFLALSVMICSSVIAGDDVHWHHQHGTHFHETHD